MNTKVISFIEFSKKNYIILTFTTLRRDFNQTLKTFYIDRHTTPMLFQKSIQNPYQNNKPEVFDNLIELTFLYLKYSLKKTKSVLQTYLLNNSNIA